MNRIYIVAALFIAALSAAAMLWVGTARYYPVVHAAFPDGTELVFLDLPWTKQGKCQEANAKMIGSLRANCSQCRLTDSCDRTMDAAWKQVLAGHETRDYVVHSGSMRIVVKAGTASGPTCAAMAEQINRQKKQSAICKAPG